MSAVSRALRFTAVVGTAAVVTLTAAQAQAAHAPSTGSGQAHYIGSIASFTPSTEVLTIATDTGSMSVMITSDSRIIPAGHCTGSGPAGTAVLVSGMGVISLHTAQSSDPYPDVQHIVLDC